jgi:LPS export ABC transporter protein LptC
LEQIIKKYPWLLNVKNIALLILVVSGLYYFISVSTEEAKKDLSDIFSEEKQDTTEINDVLATGYDFELVVENGKKNQLYGRVWQLESGKVEQGSDSNENIAKEIKILRIFKKDELNLIATGDEAVYNENNEELRMQGNIHIESEDGTTILETDTLIWHENSKELSCPKPVEIWIDDNHILADMMFSDKDMEKIDFLGRVSSYLTGFERENLATREGWVDWEDVKPKGERDENDLINVESEYLHYDKVRKYLECYPYIPHEIQKRYQLYLTRQEFQPEFALKFQSSFERFEGKKDTETQEGEKFIPEVAKQTGMEGFEGIFGENKLNTDKTLADKETEARKQAEAKAEELVRNRPRRASPIDEPFPGKFPERLEKQVYCWKQNKKIFSNRLDVDLKAKILKPRFDVYVWAFDVKHEIKKKHDRENEDPSKFMKAIANETTEMFGDYINMKWDTDFIEAWGGIEVRQKDKFFKSENMIYSDQLGLMQADGDVYMEQLDGAWLEREGLLEDMTDEDAKKHVKKPTEMTSDAMISFDEKDYVYMIGNVWVKQEDQNIISDEGEYSDEEDIMIFSGHVRFRNKDGERLDSDSLTIHTEDNRYIAEGTVTVRSLVPEEYEDDINQLEEEEGKTENKESQVEEKKQ